MQELNPAGALSNQLSEEATEYSGHTHKNKLTSAPKTQASFFRKSFAGIPRKNFVSMGVQGCLLIVISAMIFVALQKQ